MLFRARYFFFKKRERRREKLLLEEQVGADRVRGRESDIEDMSLKSGTIMRERILFFFCPH